MKSTAHLGQELGRIVTQLTAELLQGERPHSLTDMERGIRAMLLKQGRSLLGAWLAWKTPIPRRGYLVLVAARPSINSSERGLC